MKDKETIQYAIKNFSLGLVLIAKSTKGFCAIFLGDIPQDLKVDLQHRFPLALLNESEEIAETSQIVGFIEDPSNHLDILLDERGTAFQKHVWGMLRRVPIGSTTSYVDIAKKMHKPKAFRAVAKACAANTLAVVIPCHRVIRKNGVLSDYRWGIERKKILLKRENAV